MGNADSGALVFLHPLSQQNNHPTLVTFCLQKKFFSGVKVLDKCANPACFAEFRFLRNGRLFEIETECSGPREAEGKLHDSKRRLEFYWLCDGCVELFVLRCDGRHVTTVPLLSGRAKFASVPLILKGDARSAVEPRRVFVRPSLLRPRDKSNRWPYREPG